MFHVNYIVGLAEYMTEAEIKQVIGALSRKIGIGADLIDSEPPQPRHFKIAFDENDEHLNTVEIAELRQGYEGMNNFGGAILRTKIEVIKMVRARTGMGLKESKEAVDRYIERCTVEAK